jgi:DNA-binding CsgD family transcriptional regulator
MPRALQGWWRRCARRLSGPLLPARNLDGGGAARAARLRAQSRRTSRLCARARLECRRTTPLATAVSSDAALIDQIYDALGEPAAWPPLLEELRRRFDCATVTMSSGEPGGSRYEARSLLWTTGEPGGKAVTAQRATSAAAFTPRDLACAVEFEPHLSRVLRLSSRLENWWCLGRAATEALEWLPTAVVLVDAQATVLHANSVARRLIERGDGLLVARGRLKTTDARTTRELVALVRAASRRLPMLPAPSGGSVPLARKGCVRTMAATVSPLCMQGPLPGSATPRAVVTLADLGLAPTEALSVLCDTYSMTMAETHVAIGLCRGETLDQIAVGRGVSRNTVRSQLRSVLAKTGARRQADLVRLLLRGASVIPQRVAPGEKVEVDAGRECRR